MAKAEKKALEVRDELAAKLKQMLVASGVGLSEGKADLLVNLMTSMIDISVAGALAKHNRENDHG
jgi:hypothetical protein